MNRKVLNSVGLASAVALTMSLSGCGSSTAETAKGITGTCPASITIGTMAFQTGKYSSFGEQLIRGQELGVAAVNAQGGVLGGTKKLKLDFYDTASDSAAAVAALRKVEGSGDVALVGPQGTPDLIASLPVLKTLSVPAVTVGSTAVFKDTQFRDGVVRVAMVTSKALVVRFFNEVNQKFGIKKLALLHDTINPFGTTEGNAVREAQGGAVKVVADEGYALGDKDFAIQIDKILGTHPDAIWIAGTTSEAGLIMRQAQERGFKGKFMGLGGVNDPTIFKIAGKSAVGLLTLLPFNAAATTKQSKNLVEEYKAKYNEPVPPVYTGYGYDAIRLVADAINRAGSCDRSAVSKALGKTSSFEGATGHYSFHGHGDNTTPEGFMFEMGNDGTFQPVKVG